MMNINPVNYNATCQFIRREVDRMVQFHRSPSYPKGRTLEMDVWALQTKTAMDYGFEFRFPGTYSEPWFDFDRISVAMTDEEKFTYFLLCHKGNGGRQTAP